MDWILEDEFGAEAALPTEFRMDGVYIKDDEDIMQEDPMFPQNALSFPPAFPAIQFPKMERFSTVKDWKHVLYNLLVDNHNNPSNNFVYPISVNGKSGFAFNNEMNPTK